MPRPTKLTPEVQADIEKAIRAGNYIETAARYARITPATFYNWMNRGEASKSGRFFEFFEAIKKAEADAEAAHVLVIAQAAAKNWQAAAWWLERKFPDRWGRREKQQVDHSGKIEHDHTSSALDELIGRLDSIAARTREAEGTRRDNGGAGEGTAV